MKKNIFKLILMLVATMFFCSINSYAAGPGDSLINKEKKSVLIVNGSDEVGVKSLTPENEVKNMMETDPYKDYKSARKYIAPENMRKGEASGDGGGDYNSGEEGSKRVTIFVNMGPYNDEDNPFYGQELNEKFVYHTDCETLTELMNQEGLTADSGFISTICGVDGDYEISANDGHSWEGYYWELIVNGKHSDVGADDVMLTNNMVIRWKHKYEKLKW